jgi:hypothetical protein
MSNQKSFFRPSDKVIDGFIDKCKEKLLEISNIKSGSEEIKIPLITKPMSYSELHEIYLILVAYRELHEDHEKLQKEKDDRETQSQKHSEIAISKVNGDSKSRERKILKGSGTNIRAVQLQVRNKTAALYYILKGYIFSCRDRIRNWENPNIVHCPPEVSKNEIFKKVWVKNRITFLDLKLSDKAVTALFKTELATEMKTTREALRKLLTRSSQGQS